MSIHVRKAEERDIPGIVTIWEEFMEFLRCTNRHYWKIRDGRSAFSRYLVSTLSKADVLLVAAEETDRSLIGFSLAHIETLPEWFGSEQIGLLRYLAVSESYRNRGAGYEMATFVIDWFRSLGISRIELYVLKGLPASRFWSKIGFNEFMDRRFIEI